MSRIAATGDLAMNGAETYSRAPPDGETSLLPVTLAGVCYAIKGKTLVDSVSLRLDRGACTVILGPNGAGKSLLLRLMHGLIEPTTGSIDWHGSRVDEACKRQAMVFQHPVLLRRSAAANVSYALSIQGIPRRERKARVAHALGKAGLSHIASRPARVLSGGEQQRLTLARAWVMRPQVLFLDEPTSNLDPGATAAVEDLIRGIQAEGTKVIMTTHDLGQARRLAGEVLFLHKGRVLEQTPAEEFFQQPRSAEATAFVAGKLLR